MTESKKALDNKNTEMEKIIFEKGDLKVIFFICIYKTILSLKMFLYLLQNKLENNHDNQDRLEVVEHLYI